MLHSSAVPVILMQGIKVEFLKHSYPQLAPHDHLQHIHLWSLPDVAAMKLNAIANRGSKKDFYDFAALLDWQDLDKLIGYYNTNINPRACL